MKHCATCNTRHPLSAFGPKPSAEDGLTQSCLKAIARVRAWKDKNKARVAAWKESYRPRKRESEKAWRAAHPEQVKKMQAESHKRHREERNAKSRARQAQKNDYLKKWMAAHPGYAYENLRRWRKKYPDRYKATESNKYAKRKAAPGEVTGRQWKEILLFYGNACAQCRGSASERPLTVDHYIPIASGGTHDWTNVWPLCMPCNAKKHTQVPTVAPPHVHVLKITTLVKEARNAG